MRKRSGTKKKRKRKPPSKDANQMAFAALQAAIKKAEGTGKDPLAVMLGRRGGLKGGPARVAKMSEAELSASGRHAAKERWRRVKEGQQ